MSVIFSFVYRMNVFHIILKVFLVIFGLSYACGEYWTYEYQELEHKCKRVKLETGKTPVSLTVCRLFCDENPGTLWPRVNGKITLEQSLTSINRNGIQFNIHGKSDKNEQFWQINQERFREQISRKVPQSFSLKDSGSQLMITVDFENDDAKLGLDTNEHYHIRAHKEENGTIVVNITAETIFGARHAFETISQLIVFDDVRGELQIVDDFEIDDKPAYPHRGFLLDTVRNYYPVKDIKRTIDGMAMVKLNVFHWHISDSQSFPMVLKSHPEMSEIGAYSAEKVYTIENIKDISQYAYARGVLLLPEFDAPAHVGEGWQNKNATSCFNMDPWEAFCTEPACGQLDPTKDHIYDILEDIYREMYDAFGKPDRFHMGGDEVHEECWKVSDDIQKWIQEHGFELNTVGFMELWGYFQGKALERLKKITEKQIPAILWTSTLTGKDFVEKHLDKEKYIIQIWTRKNDSIIQFLLEKGYRLILSNYDNFYLDCGFGNWLKDGNNWCSPYKDWKKVYSNDFRYFDEKYRSQFLGGEAALWSEQVDHLTVDGRAWPRLSALAERLWSDPSTGWQKALNRMLIHRERLVENGIAAETLVPEWCVQHQGKCILN